MNVGWKTYFYLLAFLLLASCNPQQNSKNIDGKNDTLKFSKDQLGVLTSQGDFFDYGRILLEAEKKKFIELRNTGKLPLRFTRTTFGGKKAHESFFYSGLEKSFPGDGGDCGEELRPNHSCQVSLSYQPMRRKEEEVKIQIYYTNGLREDFEEIKLKGYGGEKAALALSIERLNFPISDKNDLKEQSFSVRNDGGQIAENISISLNQDPDSAGRNLFSIIPSKTTCPLNEGKLSIGENCEITIQSQVAIDQEYKNYTGNLQVEYRYNPDSSELERAVLDISHRVLSIEGILSIPETHLNYGNVVNGSIVPKNFLISNSGYKDLILDSISIAGDHSSINVDIRNCTERDNERYTSDHKLILAPDESCILAFIFSPNFGSLPVDFSASQVKFMYNNGKDSLLKISETMSFQADLVQPAKLVIVEDSGHTLAQDVWNLGASFVANDTRYNASKKYLIKNTGENLAKSIRVETSGSPYISVTHDCPIIMVKDVECHMEIFYTPLKSIYDSHGNSLDIISQTKVLYEAGDSASLGNPRVSQTIVETSGTMDDQPRLIFSQGDSGSVEGVFSSSVFHDIEVKNVGAKPEGSFTLSLSNTSNFFIVEDASLTQIEGKPNCAHLDGEAGVLPSGGICFYRIRSYETSAGEVTSQIVLNFQGGTVSSTAYNLTANFVGPAKLALDSPTPSSKARVTSYGSFNYPGVGQSTGLNAGGLSKTYSSSARSVDPSKMNFPSLPGAETFDFAYMELGYNAYGQDNRGGFDLKNIGDFPMEIRGISISEVRNLISLTDVTAQNYFSLDGSASCGEPSQSSPKNLSKDGTCSLAFNYRIPNTNIYRVKIKLDYTLGHKVSGESPTLKEYSSYISVYMKGYNRGNFAQITPVLPSNILTEGAQLSSVFGGDNTANSLVKLKNTSTHTGTELHYTLMSGDERVDILSAQAPLKGEGFTALSSPMENYMSLSTTKCSGSVQDQMGANETCDLSLTYQPTEETEKTITFYYRYHNGLTYEEGSFPLHLKGLKPAEITVKDLDIIGTNYSFNFEDKVVGQDHVKTFEIKNSGAVPAMNLSLNSESLPFKIRPTTDPELTPCESSLDGDATCHMDLVLSPTDSHIGGDINNNLTFSWNSGLLSGGSPVSENFKIFGRAYIEERHSLHQGWTSIKLAGFNKDFAVERGVPDQEDNFGFVEFKWNAMIGDGPQGRDITSYLIFKKKTSEFNIKSDRPYREINVVSGQKEYSFLDNHTDNAPGSVWYYYVVPKRGNTHISKVDTQKNPIGVLRAIIPHSHTVSLHRYMASLEVCKKMGFDINNSSHLDLSNNGCRYKNEVGEEKVFSVSYDLHMDRYEAGEVYRDQVTPPNAPGDRLARANFNNARSSCQRKKVHFSSTDPSFNQFFSKDLPNRREHFYLSVKTGGYDTAQCKTTGAEPKNGGFLDCRSDYGLENMVGGLKEWTLSQVNGFGRGVNTSLGGGQSDRTFTGERFGNLFTPVKAGYNRFLISHEQNGASMKCFNTLTGTFAAKVSGLCTGEYLLDITLDQSQENASTLYLGGEDPKADFRIFYPGSPIGSSGLGIYALAGGGDNLEVGMKGENYSPYTTHIDLSIDEQAGFRCSLRIPY